MKQLEDRLSEKGMELRQLKRNLSETDDPFTQVGSFSSWRSLGPVGITCCSSFPHVTFQIQLLPGLLKLSIADLHFLHTVVLHVTIFQAC